MKDIISKELLGEVVKCKDIWSMNIYETDIYTLRYAGLEKNCGGSINLFQLASMCKDWAYDKHECVLKVINKTKYSKYTCSIDGLLFQSDYEVEAIFKACQWILDNKTI